MPKRISEVALNGVPGPDKVLHNHWFIEPEFASSGIPHFLRPARALRHVEQARIAGEP